MGEEGRGGIEGREEESADSLETWGERERDNSGGWRFSSTGDGDRVVRLVCVVESGVEDELLPDAWGGLKGFLVEDEGDMAMAVFGAGLVGLSLKAMDADVVVESTSVSVSTSLESRVLELETDDDNSSPCTTSTRDSVSSPDLLATSPLVKGAVD